MADPNHHGTSWLEGSAPLGAGHQRRARPLQTIWLHATERSGTLDAELQTLCGGDITPKIILKADREKSLLRRHPWIFSGAVLHADENIARGETVDLLSFNKQFLARASYSPNS